MSTEPLPSDVWSFSRSLHSNGTTHDSTIFWDITPCSPLKVNRRFGETSTPFSGSKNKPSKIPAWKQAAVLLPKMKAICFFETSVDFLRTKRRYIPEDSTLYIVSIPNFIFQVPVVFASKRKAHEQFSSAINWYFTLYKTSWEVPYISKIYITVHN
jgi:hypothetical protein